MGKIIKKTGFYPSGEDFGFGIFGGAIKNQTPHEGIRAAAGGSKTSIFIRKTSKFTFLYLFLAQKT